MRDKTGSVRRRIEWIDLVKAVSVLLVVFMHASNTLYDLAGPSGVTAVLQHINHLLEPLRMPVFFLVSGMLASSAVHRPWSKSGNRTLGMVYLYVVWMLLFFGFITLFGQAPSEPVTAIIFAKSGFWYLYAMALFFIIARLLRNQPAWAVVAVALLPNILRPLTDQVLGQLVPGSLYTSMAMNLAFFLVGAYFKDLVGGLAEKATTWHAVVLGALAVSAGVLWLTAEPMNMHANAYGTNFVLFYLSVLALTLFLILVGRLIDRLPTVDFLGRNTLIVLGIHFPVILLLEKYVHNDLTVLVLTTLAMFPLIPPLNRWLPRLTGRKPLFRTYARPEKT